MMMQLTEEDRLKIMEKLKVQEKEADFCQLSVQKTVNKICNGKRKTNQ